MFSRKIFPKIRSPKSKIIYGELVGNLSTTIPRAVICLAKLLVHSDCKSTLCICAGVIHPCRNFMSSFWLIDRVAGELYYHSNKPQLIVLKSLLTMISGEIK